MVSLLARDLALMNLCGGAADNKSLDASGFSESLIDNLRLAPLTAAASTPPLSRAAFENMGRRDVLAGRRSGRHRARRGCGRGSERRMWSRALHSVEWFGPLHLGVG